MQWALLSAQDKERKQAIERQSKEQIKSARREIAQRDLPAWVQMTDSHEFQLEEFKQRETNIGGKIQNVFDAVRAIDTEDHYKSISDKFGEVWGYLSSEKKRLGKLEQDHARDKRAFRAEQRKEYDAVSLNIRSEAKDRHQVNLDRFYQERSDLILAQSMDDAAYKAQWKQRNNDRRAQWKNFRVQIFLTDHDVGNDLSGRSNPNSLG